MFSVWKIKTVHIKTLFCIGNTLSKRDWFKLLKTTVWTEVFYSVWPSGYSLSIGDQRILWLLRWILQLTFGGQWLFLFRCGASYKIFSCVVTSFYCSTATGILNENPVTLDNSKKLKPSLPIFHFPNLYFPF